MDLPEVFEVLSAYYGSKKNVANALFYSPVHYRRILKGKVNITKAVESYIILKALEVTQQQSMLAKNSYEEALV